MSQHLLSSLTQHQLDALLKQLIERRERLLNALNTDYGDVGGRHVPVELEPTRHRDESALQQADNEIRTALAHHDDDELQQIGAAIARMNLHRYGICIDCGRDIPYERLSASPYASRCIDCQRDEDRHRAMTHAPSPSVP
jgi:RNA polymerase-binding transcription factor DksA